jgi:hypothetical protein
MWCTFFLWLPDGVEIEIVQMVFPFYFCFDGRVITPFHRVSFHVAFLLFFLQVIAPFGFHVAFLLFFLLDLF